MVCMKKRLFMKSTALYTEVYNRILAEIRSGEYPENSPLPAERFLCDKYHVSRSTLRTALNLLSKKNIVYTLPGAGTFVQPKYYTQSLNGFYSFGETLKEENTSIKNDILDYNLISLDQTLAQKINYSEGSIFHKIVRLRSVNDAPVMVEASYLPQSRFLNIDLNAFVNDSMYEFLRTSYHLSPDKATETFKSIIPLQHEKDLLQIYGNIPCMLLERYTYERCNLVEYTRSVIRGDKYVFSVDLK